jgi:hypothetical protein
MVSVPGLTSSESATFGAQLCANADAEVDTKSTDVSVIVRNDMGTLWFCDLLADLPNDACYLRIHLVYHFHTQSFAVCNIFPQRLQKIELVL